MKERKIKYFFYKKVANVKNYEYITHRMAEKQKKVHCLI